MKYIYKVFSATRSPYMMVLVKNLSELLATANYGNNIKLISLLKKLRRRADESYKGLDWIPICRSDFEELKSTYPTKLVSKPLDDRYKVQNRVTKAVSNPTSKWVIIYEDEGERGEIEFDSIEEAEKYRRFNDSKAASGDAIDIIDIIKR